MEMIDDPRDIPTIPAQPADDRFLVSHQQQNLIYTLQARVAVLEAQVRQLRVQERISHHYRVALENISNTADVAQTTSARYFGRIADSALGLAEEILSENTDPTSTPAERGNQDEW